MNNGNGTKPRILTAADILTAKPRTLVVDVPEWGGSVIVRALSIKEVFEADKEDAVNAETIVRQLAMVLVDEDGNNVFTEDQLTELAKRDYKPLLDIFKAAAELNGRTAETTAAIEKNS